MAILRAGRAWHFACGHVRPEVIPMRRGIVILSVALAFPFPVHAAPGDPRLVQGILEWPAKLTVEPFLVIRTHDGEWLYTEIKAAKRLESGPLTAGAPVTVLGTEAKRPHEIKAVAVGSGDVAALALALVPYVNPITVASGTPSAATPESQSPSKPRETESASTAKTAGKPEQAAAPAPPATPQPPPAPGSAARSEEHTSELQSLAYLVCRLLLEKKKTQ